MEIVLMGNPGGADSEIGMFRTLAQRFRSMFIHLSLSVCILAYILPV